MGVVELTLPSDKVKRFDFGNVCRNWFEALKFLSTTSVRRYLVSSSVDHFISDNGYRWFVTYWDDNGEVYLERGTDSLRGIESFIAPADMEFQSWEDFKEYVKSFTN